MTTGRRSCPSRAAARIAASLPCAVAGRLAGATAPRLVVGYAADDVEAALAPKSRAERMGRDQGIDATLARRMALGAQVVELPAGTDLRAAVPGGG